MSRMNPVRGLFVMLAALVFVWSAQSVAGGDGPIWPVYGADAGRTHRGRFAAPRSRPRVQEVVRARGSFDEVRVANDGTVYLIHLVPGGNESLVRLDRMGRKLWEWPLPEQAESCGVGLAVGSDGTAYLCYGRVLYAVSSDGAVVWRADIGYTFLGPKPSFLPSGDIVFATHAYSLPPTDNLLYRVSPGGEIRWSFDLDFNYLLPYHAIDDEGNIFVTHGRYRLDGSESWSRVTALSEDGELLWYDGEKGEAGTPWANAEILVGRTGNVTARFRGFGLPLFTYSPEGDLLWSFSGPGKVELRPYSLVEDSLGNLWLAGARGDWYESSETLLYCLSPEGQVLWDGAFVGGYGDLIASSDEQVILAVVSGWTSTLFSLVLGGELEWSFSIEGYRVGRLILTGDEELLAVAKVETGERTACLLRLIPERFGPESARHESSALMPGGCGGISRYRVGPLRPAVR